MAKIVGVLEWAYEIKLLLRNFVSVLTCFGVFSFTQFISTNLFKALLNKLIVLRFRIWMALQPYLRP